MLRRVLQAPLGNATRKQWKKSLSQDSLSRALYTPGRSVHTSCCLAKAGTVSPDVAEVNHLDGIKSRRMYIDDIYQHITNDGVKDLEIQEDGKRLQITWDDGHVSRFHAVWLRHMCHSAETMPHTTTILVDFSKIDIDSLRVTSAVMDGPEVIVLTYESDSGEVYHEGPILTKFLRYQCYSEAAAEERSAQRAMQFNKEKIIPEIDCGEIMAGDKGLYKWLQALSNVGICLVKNVPTKRGAIREVAERIAPIQRSIYPDVFDVESSPKPMNAAYTGIALDLHMDMIHYESPPGLQLLHCIEFDECIEGGGNYFVDLHEIAHNFKQEYPDLFYTLTRVPACHETLDYKRAYPDLPAHVRIQRPLITVNHRDEIVSVVWQPMSIAALQVHEKDVVLFYKAYKQFYTMIHYCDSKYENRLRPGDMISFNNRRVLHARHAYTENGRRLLQGAYINISEFQSQVQIFHNKYGGGRWPTRCGSIDWQ